MFGAFLPLTTSDSLWVYGPEISSDDSSCYTKDPSMGHRLFTVGKASEINRPVEARYHPVPFAT